MRILALVPLALSWNACTGEPAESATDMARSPSAPVVQGFDRFHRNVEAEAARGGVLLMGELGCGHCHAVPDAAPVLARGAPRLADSARRLGPVALRSRIAAPRDYMPGTTMPDVWHGVPASRRDAETEDIVHFLTSLQSERFRLEQTDLGAAARGEELYHRIGCAACHAPRGDRAGRVPADSAPLPQTLAGGLAVEPLARFLRDPAAVRPQGRMPSLHLSSREARDIAHFLLSGTEVPGPLRYTLWYGPLISLDDADPRTVQATGLCEGFHFEGVTDRRNDFVVRFDGFLRVETAGTYTFHLRSDDGSRLWVDGIERLDLDGRVERRGSAHEGVARVDLGPGWRSIALEYFQRRGDKVLELTWEGPGIPRGPIPAERLQHTLDDVEVVAAVEPEPKRVARGRTAFAARGCAQCHRDTGVEPASAPPAMTALDPERGCLAETVPSDAPDYGLDAAQRRALRAALAALRAGELAGLPPEERIDLAMETFGCLQCHGRGGRGGVTEDRDRFFVSNGVDLGREGRMPQHLDGVGNKLRPDWLRKVLAEGASVRPYVATRMPRFDALDAPQLASDLAEADGREPAEPPIEPPVGPKTELLREAGRRLVGEGGLNCILCHRFNRRDAQTMNLVDLTTTTERLTFDWFRRYLLDPGRYRPNTRMPAFWPGGHSILPDVLDGDAERQIAAIWTYLADGERAVDPEGLDHKSVELVVGGEAIVYRGKLWEAGWRGIAVGHPERRNLAFDAEQLRLALLWKDRFLDVSAHWRVQGMGRIRPLGDDVVVLAHGPDLALLPDTRAPWPAGPGREPGYRFRGYDLDAKGRPTFRYELPGGTPVEDRTVARERDGEAVFVRTLRITGGEPTGLFLRAARGESIEADGGAFTIDGRLRIGIPGGRIRKSAGTFELLAPFSGASMTVEYAW